MVSSKRGLLSTITWDDITSVLVGSVSVVSIVLGGLLVI